MSAGAWGWPPLTRRCVAVLRRNFLVWRKTALTTALGIWLVAVLMRRRLLR
ncbi:hypothetical protein [Bordetella parapertussis]|uniref:hypothetical protein n=1 Tax=Bordetella parapertussis TaxID=519 RepID=UPI0002F319F0|nr:hypothetical protein [Bordetella parapertussis]